MDTILIVDDEASLRKLLSRMMELEGYEVFQAIDCLNAIKQLKTHEINVVLCDVFLPDGNGVSFVQEIKQQFTNVEVILLTAHGNIPDGVQAIKNGAFDYITKGDDNHKIIPLISRAMEKAKKNIGVKPKEIARENDTFDALSFGAKAMTNVISLAKKVAPTDVTVLLTGETGTGKEVFANAIHKNSNRKDKPFIAINCSAFSKDLLESELFGYKAGAFTGALKDKKGLIEVANNGTLFLDEIGEMAFELQAKLLRVLESGEYIKIGDTKPGKVNVRIISATNKNLKKSIELEHFREDLYYRLSVFTLTIPPLRERREDIRPLAMEFINFFSQKIEKKILSISDDFFKVLENLEWKGNIRELRNLMERCTIVCDNSLSVCDLPIDIYNDENANTETPTEFELAAMEKRHISKVLQYTKGNKSEASKLLKIGLTTLYRKIEEYKIPQ